MSTHSSIQRPLRFLVYVLVLLVGCAAAAQADPQKNRKKGKKKGKKNGSVHIISESTVPPPQGDTAPDAPVAATTNSIPEPTVEPVLGPVEPALDPGVPPTAPPAAVGEGEEVVDGVEDKPSTSEALARAIEWTTEGLRHYERGEEKTAFSNLNDARIELYDADLPDAMSERGLAAIHCALPEDLRHHDPEALLKELELSQQAAGSSAGAEHAFIEKEVRRILRGFGAAAPGERYLETFTTEVSQYIRFYQGKNREFFERAFDRKHKYWPTIQEVFGARGIPQELGYMALVESGFNPRARSHANARGLWQFIPSTGRRYQLRQVDDFYDVAKATRAASEYILDLIGIFGSDSFLLATASYNAGEGRVQGCLRKLDDPFGKRSFWEIRDCLARETREYVPRIMAAAVIGSDPQRFGFELATEEEKRAQYDVVTIPYPERLSTLASRAGVSVADLRTANSDLAPSATTTPVRNFPLYVPKGGGRPLVAALGEAPKPSPSPPPPRVTTTPSPERVTHRVARGDTLSEIATRYGVSVREMARWNNLRSPYRLSVGQRLTVHPRGGDGGSRVTFTVKRGNTLQSVANVFAVRYRDIMSWNNLRSSALQVGQKLVIQPSNPVRVEKYQVRRGDTVAKIARRFGVPVRSVLTANGLFTKTVIRPGQRLVIYVN